MRSMLPALALAASLLVAACGAGGERTVTVDHGPVTATVLDLGDEGPSVGDQRLFHFPATAGDQAVTADAVMVTTGSVDGVETRVTTIVITFADPADQLILQGTGRYAAGSPTFKEETTVVRPVIGGSGAYAGARGWAESIHNADDTWRHVFHLEP